MCACRALSPLPLIASYQPHESSALTGNSDLLREIETAIQSMEKRAEFLQKKIDKELQTAKDCSKRKDKRGALMALKRKNLYVKVRAAGRCALARSTRSLLRPGWADTDPKDHTRAALHRSKRSL